MLPDKIYTKVMKFGVFCSQLQSPKRQIRNFLHPVWMELQLSVVLHLQSEDGNSRTLSFRGERFGFDQEPAMLPRINLLRFTDSV